MCGCVCTVHSLLYTVLLSRARFLFLIVVAVNPSALSRARISCYICFKQHGKCFRKVLSYVCFSFRFYVSCHSISLVRQANHHQPISANAKFITTANKVGSTCATEYSMTDDRPTTPNKRKKKHCCFPFFISIQVTQLVW